MAGRLSEKNPAYVLPALRRYLIQLLTYLDQRFDTTKILVLMTSAGFKFVSCYSSIMFLKIFMLSAVWIANVERKVLDCWAA